MIELHDLHLQIRNLLEVGRVEQARQLGGQALKLDPTNAETLCLLSAIELDANNHLEAKRRAQEVLAHDPLHRNARWLLFKALGREKALAAAEAVIIELLRDDPSDADYLVGYASLLLDAYQLDKARALVAEALRCDADHSGAQLLDTLLHLIAGDDRSASARLQPMIAADPGTERVATMTMVMLDERGKHTEALEIARMLLRAAPNDPERLDVVINLRVASHWSMIPLWPFRRGGWVGIAALWALALFGLPAIRPVVGDVVVGTLLFAYLALVVYSWIGPPLLRRWLLWRGC